jgi:hypothetical protein
MPGQGCGVEVGSRTIVILALVARTPLPAACEGVIPLSQ